MTCQGIFLNRDSSLPKRKFDTSSKENWFSFYPAILYHFKSFVSGLFTSCPPPNQSLCVSEMYTCSCLRSYIENLPNVSISLLFIQSFLCGSVWERGAAATTETCPRTVSLKNKSLNLRHGSQKWYLNVLLDSHGNRGKRREKPLYLWGRGMCAPWAQQPAGGGAGDFVHLLFSPSPTRPRDTGPAWNWGLIRASENALYPLPFNTRLNLGELQGSYFLWGHHKGQTQIQEGSGHWENNLWQPAPAWREDMKPEVGWE